MSSVLGVSVGAGAIRLARPPAGAASDIEPESFELRTFVVPPETPSAERAALSVAAALNSDPEIAGTVLACRDEQQARTLHAALTDHGLSAYDIVPDIEAILEFAISSGALQTVTTLGIYDLGASGLSVTVVDLPSRTVRHTERTGDISGEYFDSLIREQQINSGRITHPPDPAGLAELDALCRAAKERLSGSNAVAMPSSYGPVLLTQENFTALTARAVEGSAHSTREVIGRSGLGVQALLAVGGGMRIPLVSRTLRETLEIPVLVPPGPEAAAARGAALLAGRKPKPAVVPSAAADPTQSGPHPVPATRVLDSIRSGSHEQPPTDPTRTGPHQQPTIAPSDPLPGPSETSAGATTPLPSAARTRTDQQDSASSRPDLPAPQHGIFGPPTGPADLPPRPGPIPARPTSWNEPDHPAPPATTATRPISDPAPKLSPEEDPPTVALRLPAEVAPRHSFGEPPQRRSRANSAALVAVSALVVVAAIGVGLGYGQHIFRQDSTTVEDTTRPQPTVTTVPSAAPAASTPPPPTHATLAEPPPVVIPPRQQQSSAPTTTTPGPNTIQVPGLPPIVVPTFPPAALPFPPPAR